MTTASPLPELTVPDDMETSLDELQQPIPQRSGPNFSLDDAFSLHEDEDSVSFDFDPGSFLKDMQSRATVGATQGPEEESDDEAIDMQHEREVTCDSTDASVSTLDINSTVAQRNSSTTPPQPSSSSQSIKSEDPPTTPSDDSPTPELDSQFTSIALSPPSCSSSHHPRQEINNAYPSVIIDASDTHVNVVKTRVPDFPSSISQQISDSSSITSETVDTITPAEILTTKGTDHTRSISSISTRSASTPNSKSTPSRSTPAKVRSGPSAFEKVVSKTRPPYLPPKQKDEDEKHSKEWEEMMQQSRLAAEKKQEELEARRRARELSVEANTSLWERVVMPDWRKAMRDPNLRKLWWDGVPTKLRSTIWERAVGNGLALSRDSYSSALARANNLIASQRFPTTALSLLESDIASTLTQLHIFHHITGPLYNDLRDLLCAWVVCRADEGLGYVEGAAKIGGMLLLNLTGPPQAFVVMRNLLERSCLRAFYGGPGAGDDVEAYYRIFDTLLADGMPKIYFNFKQHQISPSEYLLDWILPLFLNHLPLEACSRIWDVLLLEGDAFLFRAALSILASLESRLYFPDRKELMEVLKGENRAALKAAQRSVHSPIRSEHGDIVGPRYDIYGVNEETIWERLLEMAEWWKESTWQRLIVRELPDL